MTVQMSGVTVAGAREEEMTHKTSVERRPPSIGFVGTYPPTKCGIATFTASLLRAIAENRESGEIGVLSSVDVPGQLEYGPEVIGELVRGSEDSLAAGVAALDEFDVVVIQHEFGIFGGADGREIVDLARALAVPTILVLHTVRADPSPNQRQIIHDLTEVVDRVVCQSQVARDRLLASHIISPERLRVIPHGAPANLGPSVDHFEQSSRREILTWGLLGPGKGIEVAIEAVALLRDLDPPPHYRVLGETHPREREVTGDAYRDSLLARAAALGVAHLVIFDDSYSHAKTILACIRKSEIVLLPYRSREQVVSGVLVEAIASGKPIVATSFPFAVEMLATGSGITVPHDNPASMAEALRLLLTEPAAAAAARSAARLQAPTVFWGRVGQLYADLAAEVSGTSLKPSGQQGTDQILRVASQSSAAASSASRCLAVKPPSR